MSIKNKIIIICLLALSLIAFLLPNINSNAAEGLNTGIVITNGNDQMINSITNGAPNYVIKSSIISTIDSTGYFVNKGQKHNTYEILMKNASSGAPLYTYDWLYCIEHGTSTFDGDYIIEKISAITNRTITTIRYATPARLYNSSGLISPNDGSIKYLQSGIASGSNLKAKYNGKDVDYSRLVGEISRSDVYYKATWADNKSAARAYILSENEDKNYSQYSNYSSNNKKQNALWKLEGQVSTVNTGAQNLLNEANRFATYKEKIDNGTVSIITAGSKAISVEYKSDYVLVGPFKATFNEEFGDISKIKIKYNTNQTLENGFYISNSSGSTNNNVSSIVNGTDFYIKIPNTTVASKGISQIDRVSAEFGDLNAYAVYSFLIQAGTTDIQNQILIHKAERKTETKESEVEINKLVVPPIQIKLEKVDTQGNEVNGPEFKVEYSNGLESETKTVEDGSIIFTKRTPSNFDSFTATITETNASRGYKLLPEEKPIVLKYTYNSGKWNITKESGPEEENVTVTTNYTTGVSEVTAKVENKSLIEKITILKTNSQNSATKIAGAKFNIRLSNVESVKGYSTPSTGGVILLTDVTTNASGNIFLEDIVIKDLNNNVTIEIEETEAPSGYREIDGKMTVTLKRSGDSYTIHTASKDSTVLDSEFLAGNVTVTNHEIALNIKNIPIIQELALEKLAAQDNSPISGAKFNVKLENVKSVGGTAAAGTIELERTITNGKFSPAIGNIEVQNINNPVKITLEEIEAPVGYKKIDGTITIEVKLNPTTGKYEITGYNKDANVSEREFDGEELSISDNKVDIPLKDIPIMNIGGVVWEDAQTGNKEVDGPDGLFNNSEQGMAGIKVFLIDGAPVINNNGELVNTPFAQTVTTADGKYLFEGIEVKDNYHVVFAYDGMSYKAVEKGTANNASKVDEIDRDNFNKKFYIVEKDKAISPDGTVTSLEYTETEGKSELVHNDGSEIKQQYVMHSKSEKVDSSNWINTWKSVGVVNEDDSRLNINCGLTYRFFDLALGTDVKEAKVSINGKTVKYDYAQIMNGEMEDLSLDEILQGQSSKNDKPTYNLYLYASDYNYRIGDYKTDGLNKTELNPDASNYINNEGNELEVEVTYTVMLKNQSKINAIVNEFVYYYDANYTPLYIDGSRDLAVGDIVDGYKVANIQNNKITFETADNSNVLTTLDFRHEVKIPFKVNKDANGVIRGNYKNTAEITKYSTFEEGIIDVDSAPDNGITNGNITHYEDDTDEAKGIEISIKESNPRIITGTVWDDGEKNSADGKLDTSKEKFVDDVIVQLIEVKNISGVYCEYIWQETRSGNNTVKTTARNGYEGEDYTNSVVANSGAYEFKDFIPGNYIIRFIYGDGSTYDITTEEYKSSADSVKKYNGQDYQSTINSDYKASWYNTTNYQGDSVARDNEARRLEVMKYSTKIDETIGQALKDKTALNETWMCAETSRINVPVDEEDLATDRDSTEVAYEYVKNNKIVEFKDINFGLALRPQTKLTLEKHITRLKIVPTGVGSAPVVDARADIKDIYDDDNGDGKVDYSIVLKDELKGVTDGLATIVSNRNNRGFWKVETDVEELAQGATLEVEYTYVIVNDSDVDYLSKTLVEAYKSNAIKPYVQVLDEIASTVKNSMKTGDYAYKNSLIGTYLGEYYYTRDVGTNDTEVLSSVDGIEESLNEQFGEQSNVGDYFDVTNGTIKKAYIDTNGTIVADGKDISTVLNSKNGTDFLTIRNGRSYDYKDSNGISCTDWSRTAKVSTVLSSATNGEIGGNFPSYIAEMASYTNAAGRRNMNGTPGDLSYVHSEDTDVTLDNSWKYLDSTGKIIAIRQSDGEAIPGATKVEKLNGLDEFWGETIIISKPTGEDKLTGLQIAIITTISVAILGAGIVLIKKLVLKK